MKLLLVGNPGGTNVADSFLHAARQLRIEAALAPATTAFRAGTLHRAISWRLLGHKPPHLESFSRRVVGDARTMNATHVLTTGLAPVDAAALQQIEAQRIAFLTDDPWHPQFTSKWFMDALLHYDVVYTTRRSNIDDLVHHGCRDVRYLPFGYDPRHFYREERPLDADVFYAGGAEQDRVTFLEPLLREDLRIIIAGDRWDAYKPSQRFFQGHFDPAELRRATASARVNPCLVRRSNRDGHVMRSFEIPACGGCMIAEDTPEHREIFGPDREAVLYFKTPDDLRLRALEVLKDENLRARLANAAHHLVTTGGHTYKDRLSAMLL